MIEYFISLPLNLFMVKWTAIFLMIWITGFVEIQFLHSTKICFSLMYVLMMTLAIKLLML